MPRTKFTQLRVAVVTKPGAGDRLATLRADTLEEIRLYELRHGEAIGQAELAGRLDVTRGAISKPSTPTTSASRRCASASKRSPPASSSAAIRNSHQ